MWNDVKLSVAIQSEKARLDQLNNQKEQFAKNGQWNVVKALKVDIMLSNTVLKAWRAVLESDE